MARWIERVYNMIFRAKSAQQEWRVWHARTQAELVRLERTRRVPEELADPLERKYYSWQARQLLRLLPPAGRSVAWMLEVGCGSGALSRYLAEATGARYILLDIEPTALRYAARVHASCPEHVGSVIGEAGVLPFGQGTFDLVHSVGLIEHLSDDTIRQTMAEMTRVTAPGGYVIVGVPSFFSVHLIGLWLWYGKGTERCLTRADLARFGREVGLKVLATEHSEFVVGPCLGAFLPARVERSLGLMGLGALTFGKYQKD